MTRRRIQFNFRFDSESVSNRSFFFGEVRGETPIDQIKVLVRLVNGFNLRNGIANSFDAKLQNSLDALAAARSGYKSGVCNSISSFINEAQAQTGKAVTQAQAQQLIDSARAIRAVLVCK